MSITIEDLEKAVAKNAGAPEFVTLAEVRRSEGDLKNAAHVCFAGLSADPGNHQGRLLLARVLFELEYLPFAVKELVDLKNAHPDSKALERLLEKLAPDQLVNQSSPDSIGEEVIAEADFEFDILEELEEDEQ